MLKFLIGIGCGVGLGLLIAPARGEETREQLMELASRPARQKVQEVRESIAQMGADLGRQMAEKAVDKVVPEGLNQQEGVNQPSRRQG
ncbi:MAG: YtxH domain-containing protein [Candidatus Angelobacter sp.]